MDSGMKDVWDLRRVNLTASRASSARLVPTSVCPCSGGYLDPVPVCRYKWVSWCWDVCSLLRSLSCAAAQPVPLLLSSRQMTTSERQGRSGSGEGVGTGSQGVCVCVCCLNSNWCGRLNARLLCWCLWRGRWESCKGNWALGRSPLGGVCAVCVMGRGGQVWDGGTAESGQVSECPCAHLWLACQRTQWPLSGQF